MRDRHRFNLLVCLAVGFAAAFVPAVAAAQRCPEGKECTYLPALPPPPHLGNPNLYGSVLIFSAPDMAAQLTYHAGSLPPMELGLDATHVAFNALSPGIGVAPDFGVVSTQRMFVSGSRTYTSVGQLGGSENTYYLSHTRSHISGLGRRFRLGGFSMNASNGDDMGYDFVSLYAPDGATVTLNASPQVYAALQAKRTNAAFWAGTPGPSMSVTLNAGETVVLRTAGAPQVRGATGAPIDGTEVLASAPIAVGVGGRGWLFDGDGTTLLGQDDSMDGIIPMDYLGTQYVLKGYPAPHGQQVRVVADVDGTTVRRNGAQVATLAAGETYSFATPLGTTFVETNQKVAVYQTAGLYNASNDLALVTPAVFADIPHLNVPIDILTGDIGLLFVVVPTDSLGTLRIDGKDVSTQPFTQVEAIYGHPEWTAVTFANLIAGGYTITAASDLVVSLVAGNSLYGKGVFTYISRVRRPLCGNGVIDNNEQCDDGNIASFDGCSSMCMVEDRYTCMGTPSKCVAIREEEARPEAPLESNSVVVDDLSAYARCQLLGCAGDQWCSPEGCMQRSVNSVPCTSGDSCRSRICSEDNLCGLLPGSLCSSNEACRSNTCSDGHCVILTAEGQGNGLMGCALVPAGRGPLGTQEAMAVAAGVALAVAGRARRRRARGRRVPRALLWGVALVLLSHTPARAASMPGFSLSPWPVPQAGAPFLALDAFAPPRVPGHPGHSLSLRLSGSYTPSPFVIRDNVSAAIYGQVVARQTTAAATLAYWWHERVRVSATLPLTLHAQGQRVWASPVPYSTPAHGPALGDAVVAVLWSVYQLPFLHLRPTVGISVALPTGAANSYISDGKVNAGATLGVAGQQGPWNYTLSFARHGHGVRGAYQPGRKPVKWLLQPGLGRYFLGGVWHVSLEAAVSTVVATALPAYTARTLWAPALAAVRWQPGQTWALTLGLGTDITRAPGAARWRAQLAFDLVPWRSRRALPEDESRAHGPLLLTVRPAPEPPQAAARPQAPPQREAAALHEPAPELQVLPQVLHFALESPALLPGDAAALAAVAEHLQAHAEVRLLQIVGYTDDRGPAAYNLRLSLERAQAVRRALMGHGVAAERLRAQGLGASNFAHSNATRAGRMGNRRVAFEAHVGPAQVP